MRKILFSLEGHDSFIDFIKGFSILSVVCTHIFPDSLKDYTLFAIWGDMAVPLFLIVQVFHAYKNKIDNRKYFNIHRLLNRIILPFIATMVVTIAYSMWRNDDFLATIRIAIYRGGLGPGSYYIWVYLQFYLLLPFIYNLLKKMGVFC